MATFQDKLSAQWQDGLNLLLGVWLAISPWALGYAAEVTPAWNAHIWGIVIAVVAAIALWTFQKWEEWINTAIGVWLIVSPWVLGFSALQTATWNHVIVGLLAAGLALWSAFAEHDTGALAA